MTTQEALFEASATIYKQIATLRRGMPIAEAKARTQLDRLTVRRTYQVKIKALEVQCAAVWEALHSAVFEEVTA